MCIIFVIMKKFNIKINNKKIIDIKNKVKNFNWKKIKDIQSWDMGTNKSHLEEICNHWISDYSWEKEQTRINSFKNFKAKVNNLNIHFIYEKSKNKNANRADSKPQVRYRGESQTPTRQHHKKRDNKRVALIREKVIQIICCNGDHNPTSIVTTALTDVQNTIKLWSSFQLQQLYF